MPAVSLRSVTKLYPTSFAGAHSVSLDVANGEHLVIVGPSGAGKTTVLRLIAGLETPDSGNIFLDGRDVTRDPPHARHVALVAQRPALFPHRSVRRNLSASVEFRESRWWRVRSKDRDLDARVEEAARILGITGLLDRRPYDLSG